MELAVVIGIILVLLALIGVLSYLIWDYMRFKDDIKGDISDTTNSLTNEKSERLSNIKYVVDQVNTVNTDIYNVVVGNSSNYNTYLNKTFMIKDDKNKQQPLLASSTKNPSELTITPSIINTSNGIKVTNGNPGAFIEKNYSTTSTGNKYGIGQYQNGALRIFTAGDFAPATLNLSIAKPNNSFDDVLQVRNDKSVSLGGRLNLQGGVSRHNPQRWGTHFPWSDGKNYIRGETEVRGDAYMLGDTYLNGKVISKSGIEVSNTDPGALVQKNYNTKTTSDRYGVGQYKNGAMRVFTSGAYGQATVNLSIAKENNGFDDVLQIRNDKTVNVGGGLYLQGGTSALNPRKWGTHFPYKDGINYIRGDTVITGNVTNQGSLVTKGGISTRNPNNLFTRFANVSDEKNYIRGDTVVNGHTILDGDVTTNFETRFKGGTSVLNPKNYRTHFPYSGDGKNYIRGDTIVHGNVSHAGDVTVAGQLCIGNVCITKDDLNRMKQNASQIAATPSVVYVTPKEQPYTVTQAEPTTTIMQAQAIPTTTVTK